MVLPSAELFVDKDGVYRVTYEDLQGAGLDLFGVKTSEIALTNSGAPVPLYIHTSSGKTFGPGGYIEFYGQALDTLYTNTNVYVLSVNADLAQSVDVDKKQAGKNTAVATSYLETRTVDNNNSYSFSSPNGDPWYDVRLFARTSLLTRDFNIELDNVASGNGGSINVSYYGLTDFPENPDHHVQTVFNGTQISDDIFDGTTNIEINEDLDSHGVQITEGTNTLTLNLPGDTGVAFDIVNFDSFSVTYPRAFVANNGKLEFSSASSAYEVTGLDTENVVVYQIAGDGTVTKKEGISTTQTQDGYSAKFAGEKTGEYKYAVYNEEAINTPGINILPESEDINTGAAQYLVISHPDFINDLTALTDARSATYTVKVVNVEHVYDKYSGGVFDPEAIRAYIAHAEANLNTQYVLLVGGDVYDYHNYNGNGAFSFIPTLYGKTHRVVSFTPSDALLADTDGDNIQDVAIGRFPVRTSTELASIIQKTLQYPNTDHNSTAVFAADEYDGVVSYTLQSNALINNLPDSWAVDTAYLDKKSVADAKTDLTDAINEGRALTSYFGHSSMGVWTFSGLFNTTDAANLTNADRPTIVTQYGCWNTYFVEPNNNSLGHKFLLEGNKGAAAVMGPTSLTQTSSDSILGNRIVKKLLEGKTLGQASVESKQELSGSYESLKDVMLGWTVLGDPSLQINQ